jgi:hypothetical protein
VGLYIAGASLPVDRSLRLPLLAPLFVQITVVSSRELRKTAEVSEARYVPSTDSQLTKFCMGTFCFEYSGAAWPFPEMRTFYYFNKGSI